ncbi:RNA-directed DNA polymerase from mobile element jockey [Amphibalanus amphitrite]|uniref:RNA-directed DNA polymerase from mobile element jockey n=1 Tax=Amphibalanus amphitrite TaxID=1232801 RepID=A0A6A4VN65_AMPAM|nr:RNA-directed DNA polymerase from mobile element jockey [Amphibalanus amphitrite]
MVASHPGATLVLAGDLNCCLLKPAADSPGHRLTRLLTTYGLRIANTEHPTYRPANSLLDVIATSRPDLVTRAGVTRCQYGTPHDFTRLVLRCGGAGRPDRARGGRSRRAKNRRYRLNRSARSRLVIVSWNAEGLRTKMQEFQRWLSATKADVVAVQEAQLAANKNPSIPGYQTAVVTRRARGRRDGGPVKGGDVALFVRDGLQFTTIDQPPLHPLDDSTEWCATRVFLYSSHPNQTQNTNARPRPSSITSIDVHNVYRPPIRATGDDERVDRFSMAAFPTTSSAIITGDFNAHHGTWDPSCTEPDSTGQLLQDWMETNGWEALNSGAATRSGYGTGPPTAPDVSMAHRDLARRCTWRTGDDLGSDHLPQVMTVTVSGCRPRRIRKTRWSFRKASWTAYTQDCETALTAAAPAHLTVDQLSNRLTDAIMQASAKHIPRGARADPKPWALDPELERAVAERREARAALDQSPTPENREAWKRAKKKAAETEEEARKRAFRTFATEELNQHANLGRITKLLRKMEGGVQSTAPGQAINGDRGREAVEDRSKAEAFVATYAAVSKHDGITADKFVLVAYDFARAYDTIDHKMLQNKLLRHLPKCLVTWIFQLLRDRRACVEVNGVRSRDRPFRAGLPQGSVLAPTLYTLWAADLIEELRKVPRTDCYMYADDTATVSAGPNIQMALSRAQQSADMMARWATKNKMNIAGHKTQILVLSQWAPDAKNVTLKVAGSDVTATSHVKLLGVTLDRLLHFGEHCASLRRKVRPRTAQLRKLTGHSWGLREHHLRTVANGYVRGALEYAAAAWLPAASPSHVELVDRELRAAARAVTGCPMSTPTHGLMAEAGMATAEMRRTTLATRMVMRAASLPPDDPLRAVATATQHSRLSAVRGWRELGRNTLRDLGALDVPVEPSLAATLPPWTPTEGVSIAPTAGPACARGRSDESRRTAAEDLLEKLPGAERAIWIWSDGSATGGVTSGGGGAHITLPNGNTEEVRTPAGVYCSSTRAELVALRDALAKIVEIEQEDAALAGGDDPIIACLDSRAALMTLESGPAAQTTQLGATIWQQLLLLVERGRPVHLQWVPAHCGLAGNERADAIAKEAAGMDQSNAPIDTRSATRAAARSARRQWQRAWPDGWYKEIFGEEHLPGPVSGDNRMAAVDTHQLRAGHWSQSAQYLHRIGRRPTDTCQGCADTECPAARCLVCGEEADTPRHVLLRCPCLCGTRLHALGNMHGRPPDLRRDDVVAAFAAGFRSFQSRSATPRQ